MSVPSNYLSATETIALVAAGKLTVTQLAQDHLARYDERDPIVHAWAYLDKDRVMREAARLDSIPQEKRGPLHGAVIGFKDVYDTKDMPTSHGSKSFKNNRPGVDAATVQICRVAGALIIGKCHTTEFASTLVGPETTNPYDRKRTPGGSSSGSAAAVRDFQAQITFGTQTAGSMIRPGSYNGVYAFKPTWGSVSREGIKLASLILDQPGIFSRSVSDIQLLCKVFNIHDDVSPQIPAKPLSRCRFAYIQTDQWTVSNGPSPELDHAWSFSRKFLEDAGAKVEDVELGPDYHDIAGDRQRTIMFSDGGINFHALYVDPAHRPDLHSTLVDRVENKEGFSKRQILHALDSLAALRPKIDELAGQFDAIVTPSAPGEAPMGLDNTGDARFCAMWTILHVPVLNIPGFASDHGMPVGLSLVAPRYHDERLLSSAKAVAQVWKDADSSKLRPLDIPKGVAALSGD